MATRNDASGLSRDQLGYVSFIGGMLFVMRACS